MNGSPGRMCNAGSRTFTHQGTSEDALPSDQTKIYSRWLLEQQVIIRLNGIVFVHGGLTEEIAGLGYEGINRAIMAGIRNYWELRKVLIDSGKVTVSDDYRLTMGIAAEFVPEMAAKVKNNPAVTRDGPRRATGQFP